MTLKTYRAKRTFNETPEPRAKKSATKQNLPIFCVQKHAATRLHYDFRIECQGVMLSWAIPKGPSLDPSQKHLAVHVEDHPIEYSNFEGNIPPGNYGAGAVMIWDEGTYTVPGATNKKEIENAVWKGLDEGHIEINLQGKKLNGGFVLQRLKKDEDKDWLFIKRKDEEADSKLEITAQDRSVRTDRTIEEIAGKEAKSSKKKVLEPINAPKKKMPAFIKPMLAVLVKAPFDSSEWLFEIKWDGYRTLAYLDKKVELFSRNEKSFNDQFPSIAEDLSHIKVQAILDGEVVVLDKKGRSHFQLMQNYQGTKQGDLIYYVFDLLYLNGKDLRELPLMTRKRILKELLSIYSLTYVRYSDHVQVQGKALFKEAQKQNLEGIMAKKMDSHYLSKRTHEWLKIKTHRRQEAVIGGFTRPRGSRKYFGALLLGVYDENKNFVYIGSVGTGFDYQLLADLYAKMDPLIEEKCPFVKKPKTASPSLWLKPKLVCEVTFSEWTTDDRLRQPVYVGLRMDKNANEVKKEEEISDVPSKTNGKPQKGTKVYSTGKDTTARSEKGIDGTAKKISLDQKKSKEEKEFKFSNPQKIFWPKLKLSKGDLIQYYQEVSDYILPYLKNRPLTIKRFPDGVEGESFFQKDSKNFHLPSWIQTVEIEHEKKNISYFLVQDKESLDYVVNLGTIEMHPFLSEIQKPEYPDYFVIDLDPESIDFSQVIETAQIVHEILEEMKVTNLCKTSGKRGMHVCIPVGRKYTFEEALQFGQIIAQYINSVIPESTSLIRQPAKRQHKVYLDVLQNHYKQTVIAPYSARGTEFATVSTPLKWSEVKKGLDPQDFNITNTPTRLRKMGDLFKPAISKGIDIKVALKILKTKLEKKNG